MSIQWQNQIDLTPADLRKYDNYSQEFSAYVKKESIRQKRIGFYQKQRVNLHF